MGAVPKQCRSPSRTRQAKKAVLWFQHEFKIKPYDGVVGPKTWKVLRAK